METSPGVAGDLMEESSAVDASAGGLVAKAFAEDLARLSTGFWSTMGDSPRSLAAVSDFAFSITCTAVFFAFVDACFFTGFSFVSRGGIGGSFPVGGLMISSIFEREGRSGAISWHLGTGRSKAARVFSSFLRRLGCRGATSISLGFMTSHTGDIKGSFFLYFGRKGAKSEGFS